jgi:hypothetical protein
VHRFKCAAAGFIGIGSAFSLLSPSFLFRCVKSACVVALRIAMSASMLVLTKYSFEQVGREFSPLDAIALGIKTVSQADIRRLGDRIVNWLESRSPAYQLNG